MSEPKAEEVGGWMAEKRYDTPRYHYIIGSRSICGAFGFYSGPLTPDTGSPTKAREDCAGCFKRLRKMQQGK